MLASKELEAEAEPASQVDEPIVVTEEPEVEAPSAAPAAEAAEERNWVPSYSVSRQGSRSSLVAKEEPAAAEEAEAAEATVPVVVTPEEEPKEVAETKEESAASTWTPSYSVSRQGSRSSLVAKEEPAAVADEELPEPPATVIVTSDEETQEPAEAKEEPAAPEVPERPWTPSYSVSQQGSSPVHSPSELPAAEEARPERPWTPSYSVSRQGSSPMLSSRELAHDAEDVFVPTVLSPETLDEAAVKAPSIKIESTEPEEEKKEATAPELETKEDVAAPAVSEPEVRIAKLVFCRLEI